MKVRAALIPAPASSHTAGEALRSVQLLHPAVHPLYIISPCRLDHSAQLHGAGLLPIIYSRRHGNGRAHPRAHNAVAYGYAKLADVCQARIAQDDDAPAANI